MNTKNNFERVLKEHPNIDVENLDNILQEAKQLEINKKEITISAITKNLNIKRSQVTTAFKWLVNYDYLKKAGNGSRIPFFIITNQSNESCILFGRANLEGIIVNNLSELEKNIPEEEMQTLRILLKDKLNKFLELQNKIINQTWQLNKRNMLSKIEFATKAIRYHIK